jgi:4-methyl-5(b-hydroxyethyl)-thiazole monophosphate biosynthesis
MKAAVLFKDGFETIEALTVVDVFFRGKVECLMVGMDKDEVISSHNIKVKMNCTFDELGDVDLVVLPGGLPGATNLQGDSRVINLIKKMYDEGKYVAAICAGPISLETSGIIKGKKFTCAPGFSEQIPSGIFTDSFVEVDGRIITARGPAATLEFAYTLLDLMGGNSSVLREGMQYNYMMNMKG